VHAWRCLANLDCLNDIRVLDTLPISCLADKPSNGCLVLTELFTQDFYGDSAVNWVLSAEDGGRSALPYFTP
jgi:hypothetical protein